ncbi:MAG: tRNA (adenosine(37)-N6)-threonylcarbamoyltransferase complex transferase subunit TsaD [bacterium]|nr:tRNA (adenosine(37)-N6)-threonylcarbamoyltransferase complex transferase subunit TsaD [bacterium]
MRYNLNMRILGIETSCDETAVSLIEADGSFGTDFRFTSLGNALSSQSAIHEKYGGVFPNVAKGEHAKNLVPMLTLCLKNAGAMRERYGDISPYRDKLRKLLEREPELFEQLLPFLEAHGNPDVDAIAVTAGPGLEPCLWVGVNFAKALSLAWGIPIVAVNHLEGHIVMSMMDIRGTTTEHSDILQNVGVSGKLHDIGFPVLSLLISGGNTQLVLSRAPLQYEVIGRTRDDAAGEAFDKVARMLSLPYPGGPHISRLADMARQSSEVGPHWMKLPRPMLYEENMDFSFSGLKTAVLRIVEAQKTLSDDTKKAIAREFEDAVTDVLVGKTLRAVEEYGIHTVVTGGGVSANEYIRETLRDRLRVAGCQLLVCPPEFSTDNALMIALAGYFHANADEYADVSLLRAEGALSLS